MPKHHIFEWRDDLLTGVELIDTQHKEYFARVNDVLKHANLAESPDLLLHALGFVRRYVVLHFDTEQEVMQFHNYPDYEQHLELHQRFSEELEALSRTFAKDGFQPGLAVEIYSLLVDWFVRHIQHVDKRLARFLHEKNEKG